METAFWINAGSLQDFLTLSVADRIAIRRHLLRVTKPLRSSGGVTGHPKTDKRM